MLKLVVRKLVRISDFYYLCTLYRTAETTIGRFARQRIDH